VIELSRHPTDRLIRELIQTGRPATEDEIGRIVDRMAAMPFDRCIIPVPTTLRGQTYRGHTLGAREDSLTYHLTKRVVDERQWLDGTTADEYLADLRRAVRAPSARLATYERRGGHIAVTMTPTSAAVPSVRRTPASLPDVLVVYSADRGIILSGYQVSSLDQTGIPDEARWLK